MGNIYINIWRKLQGSRFICFRINTTIFQKSIDNLLLNIKYRKHYKFQRS